MLTLLAHNWPGNVRELDSVGLLLIRERINRPQDLIENGDKKNLFDPNRGLHLIQKRDLSFDASLARSLYESLKEKGVDVERLEKLLNRLNLGLNFDLSIPAFKSFSIASLIGPNPKADREQYGTISLREPPQFSLVNYALIVFCNLFFQDPYANVNLLKLNKLNYPCCEIDAILKFLQKNKKINIEEFYDLRKSVFEYIVDIKLPAKQQIPTDPKAFKAFLTELIKLYPANAVIAEALEMETEKASIAPKALDIWSMKEDELMKLYYTGVLKKTGYNITATANLIGVPPTTLRSRLDQLGINYKKGPSIVSTLS